MCSIVCRKTTASTGSSKSSTRPRRKLEVGARGSAAVACSWASGLASTPITSAARRRDHVRPVALAAGEVDDPHPAAALGDPLVDGEVAPVPVVLLGNVGERPLARQLERGHSVGLIALDIGRLLTGATLDRSRTCARESTTNSIIASNTGGNPGFTNCFSLPDSSAAYNISSTSPAAPPPHAAAAPPLGPSCSRSTCGPTQHGARRGWPRLRRFNAHRSDERPRRPARPARPVLNRPQGERMRHRGVRARAGRVRSARRGAS